MSGNQPFRPQYLLDGQQRLTSLHRVFTGHPAAEVVFDVVSEKFQLASAATRKNRKWALVHDILAGKIKASVKRDLAAYLGDAPDEDVIDERIGRVAAIATYTYHVETIKGLAYEEVTDIFVRVNSRGRNLTSADLALATLTASYPGFYDKLRARAAANATAGFPKLGVSTLVRALALLGTPTGTLAGIAGATAQEIDTGWAAVEHGIDRLLPLLRNNLDLGNDDLLPSVNALLPVIGHLGLRGKKQLDQPDADALLYWLLTALLTSRYSGTVDTKLAQDRAALLSGDPLAALYANLTLTGRYRVTPEGLIGRSTGSAAFMLSYLAARRHGAHDWWTAAKIGLGGAGQSRIEYHHIHPQATLKTTYTKAQINDIANLAFISESANKQIGKRSPAAYFPDIGDAELGRHLVPVDPSLREAPHYLEFLDARRILLADGMNQVLDSFAPAHLSSHDAYIPQAGSKVELQIYTEGVPEEGTMRITVTRDGAIWQADSPVATWLSAFEAAEQGIAAQLDPAPGITVEVQTDQDRLWVQTGPIRLEGSLEEWRHVLDREFASTAPIGELGLPSLWNVSEDEAVESISVLDCD